MVAAVTALGLEEMGTCTSHDSLFSLPPAVPDSSRLYSLDRGGCKSYNSIGETLGSESVSGNSWMPGSDSAQLPCLVLRPFLHWSPHIHIRVLELGGHPSCVH